MIILRDYNEETRIDRIWYDSSMIVYSECYDDPNSANKDLKVVFKNGGTYLYKGVLVDDYVMFVHGGLDGSNGKALNKFIKPKSEFEKQENTDIQLLNEELELKLQEKKQLLEVKEAENMENQEINDLNEPIYKDINEQENGEKEKNISDGISNGLSY